MADPALPPVQMIPVEQLNFDPENPRLHVESSADATQQELFETLWRDFAVDEIAESIAANGYFPYDPIFAYKADDTFTVIEGNRRLAALKGILHIHRLPSGSGAIPVVTAARRRDLTQIPVHITNKRDIWQYVGFKHVNGPQAWQSASKADYIAWVHNELGVPLTSISTQIGDRHSTVQRLYRALMVVQQAEEAGAWNRADRFNQHFSFSHLYTGLDYSGIGTFLHVKPAADEARRPVPKARTSELGDLCLWLFGSKSLDRPPVVRSQNPDLRRLDRILQSRDGLAALRRNLPLEISEDVARGDAALLHESLVAAKNSLQVARGRVLTGYDGERDLLQLAEDVFELADRLYNEMSDMHGASRRSPTRTAPRGQ